jgi:hypothetical protein
MIVDALSRPHGGRRRGSTVRARALSSGRRDELTCSGVEAFISLSGSKRCVFMSRVFDEQEDARASPDQEG